MTAAVPGPAADAARSASSHAAPAADASADALIAALFDAALEQAIGEIDAGRLPALSTDAAAPVPVAVEAIRERIADEPAAADGATTADAWLAIAAWRQDAMPAAVPVMTVSAVPVPPSGGATLPADGVPARPTADLLALRTEPGPDARADDRAPAHGSHRESPESRPTTTLTPLTAGEPEFVKPRASSPAPTPAAHDDRHATQRQDAPLAPSMAPSPAWVAATSPVPSAAPIDAAAFAPALAEQVVRLVHLKMDRVELAVHPAELGPVELRVTMTGADANVVVIAVHPEARAALEQSLPDLRSLLQGAGIALGETSVRDGGASRDGPPRSDDTARRAARGDDTAAAPIAVVRRRGLVDLYA